MLRYRVFGIITILILELVLGLLDPTGQAKAVPINEVASAAPIAPPPGADCGGVGPAQSQKLLTRLKQAAGTKATISCHTGTGKVRYVGTEPGQPLPKPSALASTASPEQAARSFMTDYGALFGLKDQATELHIKQNLKANQGKTFIRFQQQYQGVPVLAGELIVQVDSNRQVLSAGGELLPDLALSTQPAITAAQAQAEALAAIAKYNRLAPTELNAIGPELWIADQKLLGGTGLPGSKLVWKTEVSNAPGSPSFQNKPLREIVLVDARTGGIVLHFNQIADAKTRYVCDQNNVTGQPPNCSTAQPTLARQEGGPATGVTDVNLAYDYSGQTYDFYMSKFGRDSLDGYGLPIRSTVRICLTGCPYNNAFWSGSAIFYGAGFASALDVVGHELTHGVTEFTSNLNYYYQSGAINESLSDTFGELIDLTYGTKIPNERWLMGQDLPIGAIRSLKNPPLYGDPDKISSPYYYNNEADSGGVHTNSGVNNKAVYLMTDGTSGETGGSFNGQTITGLGVDKVARIYYELETHLLTSGSDYQDMYDYLQQACKNLVGTYGVSQNDCQQVKKVVDATEMNLTPSGSPAEAPICAPRQLPSNLFFDNVENPGSGYWTSSAITGPNAWTYYDSGYATSGQHSMWGFNAAKSDSNIRMNSSVVLPANAFLHFRHAEGLEANTVTNYDGGVAEYSLNSGTNWNDLQPLFSNNGYNGAITDSVDNPLKGRAAFVGISKGYYSSRADLSSLSGQPVQFRFRLGTDPGNGGSVGWEIDDVRIYTCVPAAVNLTSNANPAFTDQTVIFTAQIPTSATGTVDFKKDGTILGSRAVNPDTGIANFTTTLFVGSYTITADYSGSLSFAAATSNPLIQQIKVPGCTVTIINNYDSGSGSLRDALTQANKVGAACKVVDLTGVTSPINLSSPALTVETGVSLVGPTCGASGPTLEINGNAIAGSGPVITLNGGALYNLKISGTGKQQLKVNAGGSKMQCVKASKT